MECLRLKLKYVFRRGNERRIHRERKKTVREDGVMKGRRAGGSKGEERTRTNSLRSSRLQGLQAKGASPWISARAPHSECPSFTHLNDLPA